MKQFNSIITHSKENNRQILVWDKEPMLKAKVVIFSDVKEAQDYESKNAGKIIARVPGYNIFIKMIGFEEKPPYRVADEVLHQMINTMAVWYGKNHVKPWTDYKKNDTSKKLNQL